MNLDTAVKAHSEWKLKLRMAIAKKEQLNAASIAADKVCLFGKWLHGESARKYGQMKSYAACVNHHKAFHLEAGKVARAINAGQYPEAEAMLGGGTSYASASNSIGGAIWADARKLGYHAHGGCDRYQRLISAAGFS